PAMRASTTGRRILAPVIERGALDLEHALPRRAQVLLIEDGRDDGIGDAGSAMIAGPAACGIRPRDQPGVGSLVHRTVIDLDPYLAGDALHAIAALGIERAANRAPHALDLDARHVGDPEMRQDIDV